jgi:hypothetical protein
VREPLNGNGVTTRQDLGPKERGLQRDVKERLQRFLEMRKSNNTILTIYTFYIFSMWNFIVYTHTYILNNLPFMCEFITTLLHSPLNRSILSNLMGTLQITCRLCEFLPIARTFVPTSWTLVVPCAINLFTLSPKTLVQCS